MIASRLLIKAIDPFFAVCMVILMAYLQTLAI